MFKHYFFIFVESVPSTSYYINNSNFANKYHFFVIFISKVFAQNVKTKVKAQADALKCICLGLDFGFYILGLTLYVQAVTKSLNIVFL